MSSIIRLSRLGKLAAITGTGGAFYLLRDEIKSYIFKTGKPSQPSQPNAPIKEYKLIEDLPEKIPYLLVGGGVASHSAMQAIRGHDPTAKVLIITSEKYGPYMKTPLSKELWFSNQDIRRNLNFRGLRGPRPIFFELDEFYMPLKDVESRENGGVSIIKENRLSRLEPEQKIAYLENGQSLKYDKCLLAPGGRPKSLPELDSAPREVKDKIVYFRTAEDFLRLEEIAESAKRIIVIGGGFLGSELTSALVNRIPGENAPKDQEIYQIFPEQGNLGKVLPQHISQWVTEKLRKDGAHITGNVELKSVNLAEDKSIVINLSNGDKLNVDYIVCAVGFEPDVELAKSSGLEIDEKTGGYLVNSELEARTDVWVAGDASCFYDMKLGRRRVEHHDHALKSGKLAGTNMVNGGKAYTHQPMFWSDLTSDIAFEAVGIIDSSLPTVSVFVDPEEWAEVKRASEAAENEAQAKEPIKISTPPSSDSSDEIDKYSRGLIFYLKDDIIVGVLLWNLFGRLRNARRIVNEQKKYDDLNEVAKLFNLYLDD